MLFILTNAVLAAVNLALFFAYRRRSEKLDAFHSVCSKGEKARAAEEERRQSQEEARVQSEVKRALQERQRQGGENERQKQEAERKAGDMERIKEEAQRNLYEGQRLKNELKRTQAEGQRAHRDKVLASAFIPLSRPIRSVTPFKP